MKDFIKTILNNVPYVNRLYKENAVFKENACYPPGHYYSPIVSVADIKSREHQIWDAEKLLANQSINLNIEQQISLVKEFQKYYAELPFTKDKHSDFRYYFENDFYSYTDAIMLYSMIRHFKPNKLIEVGSGFSSAAILDIKDKFLQGLDITFIEPNPERLYSLLTDGDKTESTVIVKTLQSVNLDVFKQLQRNDILFIDSTHVSKTGSDVNYLLFEILPVLQAGVLIHLHDIFYPFEYPKHWVYEGKNWNEIYLLRAFLMYNKAFEVRLFSHFLHTHYEEVYKGMPLTLENTGGNFWMQKI